MRKLGNLFTLLIFLGTSFLSSISYAQSPDEPQDLQIGNNESNIGLYVSLQQNGTMFIPGSDFNIKLKNLANDGGYYYAFNYDKNITEFKKSNTPAPLGAVTTGLSTNDSEYDIVAWYDSGIIYYYTEADKIYLNPDSSSMFAYMRGLTKIDLNIFDTSKVTNMSDMFDYCSSLTELDVSDWDTSKVTSMMQMFFDCSSLTELDISNWDTSNVTNMYFMFGYCNRLKRLDVSNWNTSNVTNMGSMFDYCNNLTGLDVSNRNTNKVTNMSFMFSNCSSLKSVDVSKWDTSKVTDMHFMFDGCTVLNRLDLHNWDTSNVTSMGSMFRSCINLTELNLSSWDTSNVTDMEYMFNSSDALETIYVSDKFVTNNVSDGYLIFEDNYNLIGGNGTKFDPNYVDIGYANIDTEQNPGYFTNISGDTLIVRFFTNGGLEINPQVVTKGNTIEPLIPTKANAIFNGWYTDGGLKRSFNKSTPINSNLKLYAKWECKQGYYDNKGKCIDNNKKIEHKGGIIKITDGEKTVYIKDRNQGATQAKGTTIIHKMFYPILQEYKDKGNITKRLLINIMDLLSEIIGEDMSTIGEFLDYYDEDAVKFIKDIKSKNEAGNYVDSYGNYYYRGNNTGVLYNNLGPGEISGYIHMSQLFYGNVDGEGPNILEQQLYDLVKSLVKMDLSDEILSNGFTGGKIGEENTGWEKGSTNNPCDASKGEYLPTAQDWTDLMQVWGNINGYELSTLEQQLGGESYIKIYTFGTGLENVINNGLTNSNELLKILNLEITDNLMIPGAGGIVNAEEIMRFILELQGIDNIDSKINQFVNEYGKYIHIPLLSPLLVASDSGGVVGIYIGELGLISATSDIGAILNNIATPVRCFVDESVWPPEEQPKNNHQSGGGGRGESSSETNVETNTHGTTDEQNNIDNDKKTEEIQKETQIDLQKDNQIENKSEILTPQNNQGNRGTTSATDEFQKAYEFAHENGITSKSTVQDAKMYENLTRIQMAKILSQYAMNVLGKEPDISKGVVNFNDVTKQMNKQYDDGVTLAYQLGIMGQNMSNNNFRPNDEVTRAEFVTALSRLLYSTSDGEYKSTSKYYIHHMEKLKKEGVITEDNPNMKEKRGYVMIMLMRSVK